MQMKLSFSALLAGVLVALSMQDVEALPVSNKRSAGMVTLPLKRVEQTRGVHGQIVSTILRNFVVLILISRRQYY